MGETEGAILLAGAYLLGSIPFGMVVAQLVGAGDIRRQGSGNIGATNVKHMYYLTHARDRYTVLKRVADFHPEMYAIIFCRTRQETQEIADSHCSSKLCTASPQSLATLTAFLGTPRDVFASLRVVPLLGSEVRKAATDGSGFQG